MVSRSLTTSVNHHDRRFRKELAVILLFKLAALTLLWLLFFGPAHTVMVTPAKVNAALFAPASPPAPSKPRS